MNATTDGLMNDENIPFVHNLTFEVSYEYSRHKYDIYINQSIHASKLNIVHIHIHASGYFHFNVYAKASMGVRSQ